VTTSSKSWDMPIFWALMALALIAPAFVYPVFLMKVLCFALFACAFNLLVGYVGLLSFGHAMFFGFAAYISGYTVKVMGWPTEVGILAGAAVAAALGLVAAHHSDHGNGRISELTPKGAALIAELLPLWRQAQADMKAELSSRTFDDSIKMLKRLAKI